MLVDPEGPTLDRMALVVPHLALVRWLALLEAAQARVLVEVAYWVALAARLQAAIFSLMANRVPMEILARKSED